MELKDFHPHVVAETLKSYLRDLKTEFEPLLTYELYNAFVAVLGMESVQSTVVVRSV